MNSDHSKTNKQTNNSYSLDAGAPISRKRGFLCSPACPYMESLLLTQSANQQLRHKGQNTRTNSNNTLTLSELNFTFNNQIFTQTLTKITL